MSKYSDRQRLAAFGWWCLGKEPIEIAAKYGCQAKTVSNWIKVFVPEAHVELNPDNNSLVNSEKILRATWRGM